MKMLYTANGRYIRCCTEEGTRPVIIVCEKEYEVDVQEFMLWSILNWRILREEELHKSDTEQDKEQLVPEETSKEEVSPPEAGIGEKEAKTQGEPEKTDGNA